LIVWVLIIALVLPPLWVGVYRFAPPPVTPLMLIRMGQGQGMDYRWRPLEQISPAMVQAAVAAEDSGFCQHNGFDFRAMKKAMAHNQRRPGKVRGGSTISQQTAKNVFLWPDRSYLRKAAEAYFTVLIEALWGKRRIMEVYLNVVEMGPGIYGAEAAADRYFDTSAADLTNQEASRLAAILPSPLKWRAVAPGRYVQGRSRRIGGAMGTVSAAGLAACVGKLSGRAPSEPPDLSAAPPEAARAFVQKQAQDSDDAPPAPPASDDGALPPSAAPGALDESAAPASDAAQITVAPPRAPEPGAQ
jgi:monofunctional biosynthetic peptidoglycan transglycosylase